MCVAFAFVSQPTANMSERERAPKRLQSARVFSNTEAGMRKGESNPP